MKKATGKKTREPSHASLREMPEVNFDKTKVRRNPYGLRIAREGISINAGRGRPRKGTETGPTVPPQRPPGRCAWERPAQSQSWSRWGKKLHIVDSRSPPRRLSAEDRIQNWLMVAYRFNVHWF